MAIVAYKSTATVTNGTAGTSVVVSAPAGVVNGDRLVAFIAEVGVGSITAPAGWTLVASQAASTQMTLAIYTKVASSEPASWTWTLGASVRNWGAVNAYTGVDTAQPFASSSFQVYTTSGTTFNGNQLTLLRRSIGLMAVAAVRTATGSATTWTPSGQERADLSTNGGAGTDIAGALEDSNSAGPGVYGPQYTASQTQSFAITWDAAFTPLTEVPLPGFTVNATIEAAMGADLTTDPSTWVWTDLTTRLLGTARIRRGREDEQQETQPSTCSLRFLNTDSALTPRHPNSPWYLQWATGTPIRLRVALFGSTYTRFQGYIDSITPVWPSGSGNVAFVEVTASGIMRRLGQGSVLRSPMTRGLSAQVGGTPPYRYWPIEDESGSTRAAEFFGRIPLIPSGPINFAANTALPGSAALATVPSGATLYAPIPFYVSTGQWRVECVFSIPSAPGADTTALEWYVSGGTAVRWRVRIHTGSPPTVTIEAYNAAGTELLGNTPTAMINTARYGQPIFLVANAQLSGSDTHWGINFYDTTGGAGSSGTATGFTPGIVYGILFAPDAVLNNSIFGHVAYFTASDSWTGATFSNSDFTLLDGHSAEDPTLRINRLCSEESIPESIVATGTFDFDMAPQTVATALTLIRQCEAVEGGILTDGLNAGLDYLPRAVRSNQTAAVALDGLRYQIKLPFEPVDDDQRLHNDITVSRIGGSSARVMDTNSIKQSGSYQQSVSLAMLDDTSLVDQANHRLHLGTVAEMRVPGITIDLRNNPELIQPWLELAILGSRYSATRLPQQYVPGQLDQVLESYTETIDAVTWRVDLVGSPYQPWRMIVLAADTGDTGEYICHLDADDAALNAGITATAASFAVKTNSGPLWTTTADDFPLDINIDGEQIRVTNITGAASPQTFTVTRSINGVVKSHAANAAVTIWQPPTLGM